MCLRTNLVIKDTVLLIDDTFKMGKITHHVVLIGEKVTTWPLKEGRHSTEVAFALLSQLSQVRISALPKFSDN